MTATDSEVNRKAYPLADQALATKILNLREALQEHVRIVIVVVFGQIMK